MICGQKFKYPYSRIIQKPNPRACVRALLTDTNLLDTQSSVICGLNFAPSLL